MSLGNGKTDHGTSHHGSAMGGHVDPTVRTATVVCRAMVVSRGMAETDCGTSHHCSMRSGRVTLIHRTGTVVCRAMVVSHGNVDGFLLPRLVPMVACHMGGV